MGHRFERFYWMELTSILNYLHEEIVKNAKKFLVNDRPRSK